MKEKKFLIADIAVLIANSALITGCGCYYILNSSMYDIFGEAAENFGFALLFLWLPFIFLKVLIYLLFVAGLSLLLQGIAMAFRVALKKGLKKIRILLRIHFFAGISFIFIIATVLIIYVTALLHDAARTSVLLLVFLSLITAISMVWQILNFKAIKEWDKHPVPEIY